jgi:hypothetical protein
MPAVLRPEDRAGVVSAMASPVVFDADAPVALPTLLSPIPAADLDALIRAVGPAHSSLVTSESVEHANIMLI